MATNPVKKHLTFTLRDFYSSYEKNQKGTKFPKRPYKKYRDFIRDVFSEIFSKIIRDGWHFVLPYSLGEFYLQECKWLTGKRVRMGWKDGKPKYGFQNHSLRKTFRFVWDRSYTTFTNGKYYTFKLVSGKEKLHQQYDVGKASIDKHLREVGDDPYSKGPIINNVPERVLREPTYDD